LLESLWNKKLKDFLEPGSPTRAMDSVGEEEAIRPALLWVAIKFKSHVPEFVTKMEK
jgi:hypothetical protein